jgi:putative RNA 2'-phosphotransferase
MSHINDLKKQAKFLTYILGAQPDEFGLVPNKDGFVKIKDLLKAIHEEDGWRAFRQSQINEIMISLPKSPFEISENTIRARNRDSLPKRMPPDNPPKLLYTCIRRKALYAVVDKGISPMGRNHVILSSDRGMALRIGRRFDTSPALLTVNVHNAMQSGILFLQTGKKLFLARNIPVGCFTSPPLPKEPRQIQPKVPIKIKERDRNPGSFFPDLSDPMPSVDPKKQTRKQRREKEIAWKKSRKHRRRR